jgi:hypothetical protein
MSDKSEELRKMNLAIQVERSALKLEVALLGDRKKALKEKENEYFRLSLAAFEQK